MRTDVARDVHHHKDKNALLMGPDPVQRAFNWFFFGVERRFGDRDSGRSRPAWCLEGVL